MSCCYSKGNVIIPEEKVASHAGSFEEVDANTRPQVCSQVLVPQRKVARETRSLVVVDASQCPSVGEEGVVIENKGDISKSVTVSRCHHNNNAGQVAAAAAVTAGTVAAASLFWPRCSPGEHPAPADQPTEQGPSNPGARAWISQDLFDYARELSCLLIRRLNGTNLGNETKEVSGGGWTLQLEVKNITLKINTAECPLKFTIYDNPPGLSFDIQIPDSEFTFDYSASARFGFLPPVRLNGTGSVSIFEGYVKGDLDLYVSGGYPQVRLRNLDLFLALGDVYFSGALDVAAKLLNLLTDAINSIFNSQVFNSVLENGLMIFVNGPLNERIKQSYSLLRGLPGPLYMVGIDYSMTNFTAVQGDPSYVNSVGGGLKLAASVLDYDQYYPVLAPAMPEKPPDHEGGSMLSASVQPWTVNGVFWVLQEKGLLSFTVLPEDIPSDSPLQLYTNDFLLFAPGLIFYLRRPMTLTVTTSGDPELSLSESPGGGEVTLTIPTVFKFNIVQSDSSSTFAFSITATIKVSAELMVVQGEGDNPQKFVSQLSVVSIVPICPSDSDVGPLNCCLIHTVGRVLQKVIRKVVVPKLNEELTKGIELPAVMVNTSIDTDVEGNAIRVYSDLDVSKLIPFFEFILGLPPL